MPWHRKVLSRILNRSSVRTRLAGAGTCQRLPALSPLPARAARRPGAELRRPRGDPGQGIRAGWHVVEIPFTYYPRDRGSSHARIFRFGLALLSASPRCGRAELGRFGRLRERAFTARIPLQRYCSDAGIASSRTSPGVADGRLDIRMRVERHPPGLNNAVAWTSAEQAPLHAALRSSPSGSNLRTLPLPATRLRLRGQTSDSTHSEDPRSSPSSSGYSAGRLSSSYPDYATIGGGDRAPLRVLRSRPTRTSTSPTTPRRA